MTSAVITEAPARTVLDGIAESFRSICEGTNPPAIDGTVYAPALPSRVIVLDELKGLLLDRATPANVRDAVWAELINSARTGRPEWTIGAVGVAMPALLGMLRQFRSDFPDTDVEDLAAEVLAGFLAAVKTIDIDRPGIMTRVNWAVFRSARRCAYTEVNAARATRAAESASPKPGFGHVDLVVARAIAEGVVTRAEADLIVTTRLEHRSLIAVAEVLGTTANALRMRRRKAEARLAEWLTGGEDGGESSLGRSGESAGRPDRFSPNARTSGIEAAVRGLAA